MKSHIACNPLMGELNLHINSRERLVEFRKAFAIALNTNDQAPRWLFDLADAMEDIPIPKAGEIKGEMPPHLRTEEVTVVNLPASMISSSQLLSSEFSSKTVPVSTLGPMPRPQNGVELLQRFVELMIDLRSPITFDGDVERLKKEFAEVSAKLNILLSPF